METQDKIFDANDDFVAHITGAGVLVDEHNARLIVAAVNWPAELLVAAKMAFCMVDKTKYENTPPYNALLAAIAKAEESER